ncbi:hypothetical protein [Lentibacillus sediminis]|uniref:hypothetical protein n=1 Tax=Lentibacillus sediminis TaxID=1940529 RepID=UPI000C1B7D43|nr:hypothetical protein [Lentibacillus sediminis]
MKKLLILMALLLLMACSNGETEQRTYTAETEHWRGEIVLEIYEPAADITESAQMEAYYTGESNGTFEYKVHAEWMENNYMTGEGSLPSKEEPWEQEFKNYNFLAGYQQGQQFTIEVTWMENGEEMTETLVFKEKES